MDRRGTSRSGSVAPIRAWTTPGPDCSLRQGTSPSALRGSPRRRLPALLLAFACGGLASGCGDDPEVASFADDLGHQGDHVTSGLISVPGGVSAPLDPEVERELCDLGYLGGE